VSTSRAVIADAVGSGVLTASPGRVLRRRGGWIAVIAVVVLAAIALVIIRSSSNASAERLDPANPGPKGSRALVQVLEQHGVTVVPTDSLVATRAAVGDPSDTTVLVYDPHGVMTSAQRTALLGLGADVVAVEPGLLALDELAPSVGLAGELSGTFAAGCDVPAARKAGRVTGSGLGYRADSSDAEATACFTTKGISGLVQLRNDGGTGGSTRTVTLLGLGSTLENGTIASRGDAALALNLLGAHHSLVWYIASFADLQSASAPTIAELTPNWVTPLLILFAIMGVAAMIWRGRRFGPIVVENLPVTVRASETMEGRARLYARSNARLRALDALRIGSIDRLARQTGQPRTATVDEIVDAVAALLGRDRGEIASLLLDAIPTNDAALVHFSDLLLALEADVARAILDPTQNGQHG
jgi:hypothetical protein